MKFSDLCNLTLVMKTSSDSAGAPHKTSVHVASLVLSHSVPRNTSALSKGRSDGAIRNKRGGEVEMRTPPFEV